VNDAILFLRSLLSLQIVSAQVAHNVINLRKKNNLSQVYAITEPSVNDQQELNLRQKSVWFATTISYKLIKFPVQVTAIA